MPRLEADSELITQADKSGMIHIRKHPGEFQVLPKYGTEDFGVSAYEPIRKFSPFTIILSLGAAGLLAWKFRDQLLDQLQVLLDYALILDEASKS